MKRPEITRAYETVLYGDDLTALSTFYADVLGLRLVEGPDDLLAAFRLADGGVLLLFDAASSRVPDRLVPSHGAVGAGHVAFSVPAGSLDAWRTVFERNSVPIDRQVEWPGGGRSLYVRDPAGNSVELTDHELWPL